MKIKTKYGVTTYILKLTERELKVLVSVLATSDMKKSSNYLVDKGENPSFEPDGGDDMHFDLFVGLKDVVGWS